MSEAKFTKGEWRVRGSEVGVVDESDTQSYGMMLSIARVDEYDFPDEYKANAHLIAAAPEMYNLLERLTNPNNCKKDIIHLLGEADNLLAKARGE
ncbi:MAG: hypothetical protein VYC55_08000 [Pseudomonadota bacterium]|nr:hypothetical protein [Pseudomonadota bacterium]